MVKKSFLGRFFRKKETESKKAKKSVESKGSYGVGTATATKRGDSPPLSGRTGSPVREGRVDERKDHAFERRMKVTASPKPDELKKEKPEPPEIKKNKAVEPEILTGVAKVASESHEKIDVIAKKMTAQEEVTVKISDGIKGLSSMLNNIDQRLEEQTQQSTELVRSVKSIPEMMKDLPESSRAGVELLQTISQILENQSRATVELGSKIHGLPDLLTQLSGKIDREADERAAERSVIKESFDESVGVLKSSITDLEQRQEVLGKTQGENTKMIVDSFKTIQKGQQDQINRLIEKNRMTNRLIFILLLIVAAGIVGYVLWQAGVTFEWPSSGG